MVLSHPINLGAIAQQVILSSAKSEAILVNSHKTLLGGDCFVKGLMRFVVSPQLGQSHREGAQLKVQVVLKRNVGWIEFDQFTIQRNSTLILFQRKRPLFEPIVSAGHMPTRHCRACEHLRALRESLEAVV